LPGYNATLGPVFSLITQKNTSREELRRAILMGGILEKRGFACSRRGGEVECLSEKGPGGDKKGSSPATMKARERSGDVNL